MLYTYTGRQTKCDFNLKYNNPMVNNPIVNLLFNLIWIEETSIRQTLTNFFPLFFELKKLFTHYTPVKNNANTSCHYKRNILTLALTG